MVGSMTFMTFMTVKRLVFFRVSGEIHLSVVSPWLPPVRDRRSAPAFPPPSQRGHYPHPRPPDLERDRTELIR